MNQINAFAAPIRKELPLKEELIEPLLGAWIRLNNSVKGNRFLSGISYHQMIVLKIIGRDLSACVTAADIGRETKLLKSQVNAILHDMEQDGLIEREHAELDGRKIRIKATEKGQKTYEEHHVKIRHTVAAITSALSDEDIIKLTALLTAVVDKADAIKGEKKT